jgi:hypothetical protein
MFKPNCPIYCLPWSTHEILIHICIYKRYAVNKKHWIKKTSPYQYKKALLFAGN